MRLYLVHKTKTKTNIQMIYYELHINNVTIFFCDFSKVIILTLDPRTAVRYVYIYTLIFFLFICWFVSSTRFKSHPIFIKTFKNSYLAY